MKQITKLLSGLMMVVLMAGLMSIALDVPIAGAILACLGLSILLGYINSISPKRDGVVLQAGLLQDIWLAELADRFFDDDSFLMDGKNWDPWVESNAINLAEIGAAPAVQKNRSSYPIAATQRTDTPLNLPLDDYSTDSTVIRDVEAVSLAYDKRKSVIVDHKRVILQKIADDGLYNIAPSANTADTPIFKTSGAVSSFGTNKILTSNDIMVMAVNFDNRKFSKKGRTIVVPPTMFWEFVNTDSTLKAQAQYNGKGGTETDTWVFYMGFIIKSRVTTAGYNKAALTKLAYGAVANGTTEKTAAVAYIAGESFGRCKGDAQMYATIKDPGQQGDIINFRQRALVLPLRQKTLGAILYSD